MKTEEDINKAIDELLSDNSDPFFEMSKEKLCCILPAYSTLRWVLRNEPRD